MAVLKPAVSPEPEAAKWGVRTAEEKQPEPEPAKSVKTGTEPEQAVEVNGDLLKEIENGYDIVIGSRFVTEKKPFSMRMLGNRMIERAIKFSTGKVLTDPTSGMRMYSKKIIHEFASNINYGPEPDTISFMIKQGASVKDVQVKMDERTAGESYLNLTRSIAYMLRMMLSILFIQNFRKRRKAD